jgi:CelD/BcsL family acetyltransferase involved in cellulose biosynthesis
MTVRTLDPLQGIRWADFVERHHAASVFHSPAWLKTLQQTYGYEAIVYTTSPDVEPLSNGVVFSRIHSRITGRRIVSVPFADHCQPLVKWQDECAEIAAAVRAAAASERAHIELRPKTGCHEAAFGMFSGTEYRLHVLNLEIGLTKVFEGFHKSGIQRKIRRARREGVARRAGRSAALLEDFYRLIVLTRQRHGMVPQPLCWFANLIESFREQSMIHVAYKGECAVAGILTLRHRDTLVYKYGGSDTRYHAVGAMPFLFWEIIQEAIDSGIRSFDLGRSDCDNLGLIAFKERLGARSSTIRYIQWPESSLWTRGMPSRFVRRIVSLAPQRLLVFAGHRLYQHLG